MWLKKPPDDKHDKHIFYSHWLKHDCVKVMSEIHGNFIMALLATSVTSISGSKRSFSNTSKAGKEIHPTPVCELENNSDLQILLVCN